MIWRGVWGGSPTTDLEPQNIKPVDGADILPMLAAITHSFSASPSGLRYESRHQQSAACAQIPVSARAHTHTHTHVTHSSIDHRWRNFAVAGCPVSGVFPPADSQPYGLLRRVRWNWINGNSMVMEFFNSPVWSGSFGDFCRRVALKTIGQATLLNKGGVCILICS